MSVRIRTPSRIHITLIDMNGSLGRIDGGVGLALSTPFVEIVAEEDEDVIVEGDCLNRERFERVAKALAERFNRGIRVKVLSDYRAHVGLGSGTQISLAVAKAFDVVYDLGLSIRELATIVGRGGTSGIGIAAFEFGGFIVDGGHSKREKSEFLPSSASKAKPAPVISRLDFPDWKIVLAIPDLTGFHSKGEIDLFRKVCPISLEDVREICHLVLMKMLPAIVEEDLDDFIFAVSRIQRLGFKRAEIDMYGDLIWNALEIALGMSSTGPCVYAVTDTNTREIERDLRRYFEERGLKCETMVTKARNEGASIN